MPTSLDAIDHKILSQLQEDGRKSIADLAAAAAMWVAMFAAPAPAEVEKILLPCDGRMCPFFRASFVPPDGWVEDKENSRKRGALIFVPRGQTFNSVVPTSAMWSGNFAGRAALKDPSGGTFLNNQIPASRIVPQAAFFQQFFPLPNSGNTFITSPAQADDTAARLTEAGLDVRVETVKSSPVVVIEDAQSGGEAAKAASLPCT